MAGFWVQLDGGAMKFPERLDVGLEERGSAGARRVLPFAVEGKCGKEGLECRCGRSGPRPPAAPWFPARGGGAQCCFSEWEEGRSWKRVEGSRGFCSQRRV